MPPAASGKLQRKKDMQYGFVVDGWDIRTIGNLTEETENAGWDGLFISDAIAVSAEGFPDFDFFDPWVGLAVMATRSERLRIGTMITAGAPPPGAGTRAGEKLKKAL